MVYILFHRTFLKRKKEICGIQKLLGKTNALGKFTYVSKAIIVLLIELIKFISGQKQPQRSR